MSNRRIAKYIVEVERIDPHTADPGAERIEEWQMLALREEIEKVGQRAIADGVIVLPRYDVDEIDALVRALYDLGVRVTRCEFGLDECLSTFGREHTCERSLL